MIEKVNSKEAREFLNKYFKDYSNNNDPYENIAIYKYENIVGAISYSVIYERAEINYIVVDEESRHQGIGTKLLIFALEDVIKAGCTIVTLEVRKSNKEAINLYLKQGFKEVAKREKYYKNEDGILMSKELR